MNLYSAGCIKMLTGSVGNYVVKVPWFCSILKIKVFHDYI